MNNMFALRKLQEKDAGFMLEWMHDEDVVRDLQTDFATKTLSDCMGFIERAQEENSNLHLAIVNDKDEYLGTVSLKNITKVNAEFGTTIRKCAMGTGCAIYAMRKIIYRALDEMKLCEVYWCVSSLNKRALRFYDKNGYKRVALNELMANVNDIYRCYDMEQAKSFIWYHVVK